MFSSPRKAAIVERYISETPKKSPTKSRIYDSVLQPRRTLLDTLSPVRAPPRLSLDRPNDDARLERVIEGVEFDDDYYLNLLDWSPTSGIIITGQHNRIVGYIHRHDVRVGDAMADNAANSVQLARLPQSQSTAVEIASVACRPMSDALAISTKTGRLFMLPQPFTPLAELKSGHCGRIGVLSWRPDGSLLSSGGRDYRLIHRDPRSSSSPIISIAHQQEICGVRWDPSGRYIASGGNDNCLNVWDIAAPARPLLHIAGAHMAAIKALAWESPTVLYSGGGSSDRRIHQWSLSAGTLGTRTRSVNTGSQVCTLWASSEVCPGRLVSTHGFTDHHISLWSFPDNPCMDDGDEAEPLQTLTGHTQRVLYAALSPDGRRLASGSGDGSIRVWRCFEERGKARVREQYERLYLS